MTSNGGNPNNLYLPLHVILFENPRTRTLQWLPLQLILVTSKPNQTKQCIFTPTYYTFWKIPHQGQCNGDLCSWFGWQPNQTKPNNAYLPLHDLPIWKRQTKDIVMVTSAAFLWELQTKLNQIMHIHPYMTYLLKIPQKGQCNGDHCNSDLCSW